MNKIRKRKELLHKRIAKIYKEITELQISCPHENYNKKYRSDTGNYDKSNDSYWIEYNCLDCGRFWMKDQ